MHKRFLLVGTVLLAILMLFSGCGKKSETRSAIMVMPKTNAVREVMDKHMAIATKKYVIARLRTAQLGKLSKNTRLPEVRKAMRDAIAAWQDYALYNEKILKAVKLLKEAEKRPDYKVSASLPRLIVPATERPFWEFPVAEAGGKKGSVESTLKWAERITKDFDNIKTGDKFETLGKQMGADATTAVAKLTKAQSLGVRIISEEEFGKMIGEI